MRVLLIYYTPVSAIESIFKERGLDVSYESILDHVYYMFEIEGCSRVTSHQLVRHRVASYDQESQRFSAATKESAVVPPSISKNEEALSIYNDALGYIYKAYEKLVSLGIPKEDARYILPSALMTKLVMTISARSLMHLVWLRTAIQAQWEIRDLASQLYRLAKQATPEIWERPLEQ